MMSLALLLAPLRKKVGVLLSTSRLAPQTLLQRPAPQKNVSWKTTRSTILIAASLSRKVDDCLILRSPLITRNHSTPPQRNLRPTKRRRLPPHPRKILLGVTHLRRLLLAPLPKIEPTTTAENHDLPPLLDRPLPDGGKNLNAGNLPEPLAIVVPTMILPISNTTTPPDNAADRMSVRRLRPRRHRSNPLKTLILKTRNLKLHRAAFKLKSIILSLSPALTPK